VLALKQHALVTVDDKDLVAMHSLTQLAVPQLHTPQLRSLTGLSFRAVYVIATVYPEVDLYPSDMPPLLARLEPSHEYIRPH
jgi:hypothetical protein